MTSTVSYIKKNPGSVLIRGKSFSVPVIFPRGFGSDVTTIVNHTISFKTIRAAGRLGDDIFIPSLILGLGVTVAPEQVENYSKGASFNEVASDLLIDAIGFGVSELAGDIVGILGGGLPGMFITDVLVGAGYDELADEFRSVLEEVGYNIDVMPEDLPQAIPVPTPPPPYIPEETPSPR
ncbi:MAG: hypothetical protein M5U11_08730 [Anaerolineales bacterium]|nr:hypothetical protein [Anaerolineales bacterium]MDX9936863.1 hypothetical protein [Anaerolineales bacterium]